MSVAAQGWNSSVLLEVACDCPWQEMGDINARRDDKNAPHIHPFIKTEYHNEDGQPAACLYFYSKWGIKRSKAQIRSPASAIS